MSVFLLTSLMARISTATNLSKKLAKSLDSGKKRTSQPGPAKTETMSTTSTEPETVTLDTVSSKQAVAERIVLTSTGLAAGAGAIPLPIWDVAAVTAIQLKMLADVSSLYGVPFKDNLGKSAIAALLGGLAPEWLARGVLGVLVKAFPGVGSIAGAVATPALSAAFTYGIGRVFIRHYESKGTLLTFKSKEFKETFTEEVKSGIEKVSAAAKA